MAIHVQVTGARIVDNKIALSLETTNDDFPGDTRQIDGSFAATASAVEIKADIDVAVTLLWTALGSPLWTV